MAAVRKVHRLVKRRRGVTLIEAVLYIAVSLALIVGGLVFFQQASTLTRINASVQVLGSIVAEARAVSVEGTVLAASGLHFENVLYRRGGIPQSSWDATRPSGQRLQRPFRDSYAFVNVSFGGGLADEILLNMVNIPLSMCVRVGASANGTNLLGAGINQTSLKDSPTALVTMFIGSLDAAGMATTCKVADTNGDGRVMLRINFRTWS
jgi:hypothetical protein